MTIWREGPFTEVIRLNEVIRGALSQCDRCPHEKGTLGHRFTQGDWLVQMRGLGKQPSRREASGYTGPAVTSTSGFQPSGTVADALWFKPLGLRSLVTAARGGESCFREVCCGAAHSGHLVETRGRAAALPGPQLATWKVSRWRWRRLRRVSQTQTPAAPVEVGIRASASLWYPRHLLEPEAQAPGEFWSVGRRRRQERGAPCSFAVSP